MIDNPAEKETDQGRLFTDELARTVLNSLSAHIAILDEDGVIVETNTAWRNYAVNKWHAEGYDCRWYELSAVCDATKGSDVNDAGKVAEGIRAVIGGD